MTGDDQNVIVELSLPASYQNLNILGAILKAMLERVTGILEHEQFAYSAELAVHEICTNIVEHAYELRPGRIRAQITLQQKPRQLVVDLFDNGKSFDPATVGLPDLTQMQEGGYGLYLVQQLMDEVMYEPGAENNHWRLVKYIQVEEGTPNGDHFSGG